MGKRLNSAEMQTIFEILQKSYDVYGPTIYQGTGCFSDTDIVRYGLLNSCPPFCASNNIWFVETNIVIPPYNRIL